MREVGFFEGRRFWSRNTHDQDQSPATLRDTHGALSTVRGWLPHGLARRAQPPSAMCVTASWSAISCLDASTRSSHLADRKPALCSRYISQLFDPGQKMCCVGIYR